MFDQKEAQVQLEVQKKELLSLASDLVSIDGKRGSYLYNCLKSKLFSEDLTAYRGFIASTENSIIVLEKFTLSYEKILAYVLLLEAEGHRSRSFQDLFARYQLMEKMIKNVIKIRKKECKLISSLTKEKSLYKIFSFDFLRNSGEHFLKSRIRREIRLLLIILNISKKSKEEAELMMELIKRESKKETVSLAVSGALFLLPGVGSVLFAISSAVYSWLNSLTPNYKKLSELLE